MKYGCFYINLSDIPSKEALTGTLKEKLGEEPSEVYGLSVVPIGDTQVLVTVTYKV